MTTAPVQLEALETEIVPLMSVVGNSYNPNRQTEEEFDLLCRSIREDGYTQFVLVHKSSREIVDGYHRWLALQKINAEKDFKGPYDTFQVVYGPPGLSPEQMRIATLRHNRARGQEDLGLTVAVIRDLEKTGHLDVAQDALQMSDLEVQAMLSDDQSPDLLAGAEFSETWVPVSGNSDESELAENADKRSTHMTTEAREVLIDQEKRMQTATTEDERKTIKADTSTFRLSLLFAGEEATLVRTALGPSPAATVLGWAYWYVGQSDQSPPLEDRPEPDEPLPQQPSTD